MDTIKLRCVYLIENQQEWNKFTAIAYESNTKWRSGIRIKKEDFGKRFPSGSVCIWVAANNMVSYSDYEYYQNEILKDIEYPYFISMKDVCRINIDMEAFDALLGGLA